jgi:peptide/nickel transport system ATP-binding protein
LNVPVLKVRDLNVAFHGHGGPFQIIDRISFDVHAGEIVGLVGESGCGKSVTAKALMGLFPRHVAQTGSACLQLAGTELSRLDSRGWRAVRGKQMAMIFQEPSTALDPVFTIGYQITRVIRRHHITARPAARQHALQALEHGGFTRPREAYDAYPHQLSGGMRQLAVIAMAVATRPRLLIADEPTTALDVTTQSLILKQLKMLRDKHGTAVLLVTHDLGVAAQCCSRAMVMYCGRLVEQSDYARLYRHPLHPYTEGLLAAVPRIGTGRSGLARPIPGRVPAFSEIPAGCHFAGRCARADGKCLEQFPDTEDRDGTRVACHHPLGTA